MSSHEIMSVLLVSNVKTYGRLTTYTHDGLHVSRMAKPMAMNTRTVSSKSPKTATI